MTETTKTIFEKYEIRKTKKQKADFVDYVRTVAEKHGYTMHAEKGSFGAKNIVIGDPETAKAIFTAHYDTCPRLPFPNFITPKNFLIYLLYQIVVSLVFMILPVILLTYLWGFAVNALAPNDESLHSLLLLLGFYVILFGIMLLMMIGPANRHTANDNTSGVTTLLDIMTSLPDEKKNTVCFVFFDMEEMGLLGSSGFASKHKKAMKQKLLVNFDCVSDGDHMLFALRKGAASKKALFEEAFPSTDVIRTEILTKGVFYPSDQANFPVGVGVAALKKAKKLNLLYMDKIHTPKDTIYREENVTYLVEGAKKLLDLI